MYVMMLSLYCLLLLPMICLSDELSLKKSMFGGPISSKNCDVIHYNGPTVGGLTGGSLINCDSNSNNLIRGQCAMSLADAIVYCNQISDCVGYLITTNKQWHTTFDRNGITTVLLYGTGATFGTNQEWYIYTKQCLKYIT
ncbi:hypothetical protein I4U23_004326 [Adineta vaga]|nr:hypothetical protein I4U23_004326 [Adineta vaga]